MKLAAVVTFTGMLTFAQCALASERPNHFEGESSPTLEAALSNLAEYNKLLTDLLNSESLAPHDMHQVHQLTYTLENALNKLGSERDRLAELLEQVHKASESFDTHVVKSSGRAYLEGSAPLAR